MIFPKFQNLYEKRFTIQRGFPQAVNLKYATDHAPVNEGCLPPHPSQELLDARTPQFSK
jgi:hypothetical protein